MPTPTAPTQSSLLREHASLLLVLCAITLLFRVVLDLGVYHHRPAEFWAHSFEPEHIAAALVQGEGYSSPLSPHTGPTAWNPPVYPLLIALVFKLFGLYSNRAVWVLLGVNALSAMLTSVLLFRIGVEVFNAQTAFLGTLAWAISPDTAAWAARNWESSLGALVSTLTVVCFLKLMQAKQPDWRAYAAYGALWGICGLTTATLLALMPLPLLALALRDRWSRLRAVLLSVVVATLVLVPWTARNYLVFHKLIPVRGNFGAELWSGNHPGVTGPLAVSRHPLTDPAEQHEYAVMGEAAYMASRQQMATAFIRQHPRLFVHLCLLRVVSFWTSARIVPAVWPALTTLLAAIAFLLLLGSSKRMFAAPFASALLVFPLPYYISHAENYFRFPIEPLVLLLAAHTVATALEQITGRGRRQTVTPA
ncbi:MAG: glycosyltransferase family 39 protein [Acidobacteriota bacterium]|nr:glycosyltransferase family 39 protein [Acidobacteriota bacterium]